MSSEVFLRARGRDVGSIELEPAATLRAQRTAEGFCISIPARLIVRGVERDSGPAFTISNLECTISVRRSEQELVEVGFARDRSIRIGCREASSESLALEWRGSLAALAYLERLRDGRPLQLSLLVSGQITPLQKDETRLIFLMHEGFIGFAEVQYAQEAWISALRSIGVIKTALVEIPVPASPPTPWDTVWKAYIETREALQQGGNSGAKACMAAVRLALERWRTIEREALGEGWTPVAHDKRNAWTKKQRVELLRHGLLQFAHLAPHCEADEWTRNDAVLGLAALSSLLIVRDP